MDCSLYIHIPFCISKCAYCDFFSQPYKGVPDAYLQALVNELSFRLSDFKIAKLNTIYIGGGTPSLLTNEQFSFLFEKLNSCVKLNEDIEITVEVNPDDVNEALLDCLFTCGVTRISCGIQSLNNSALRKACRRADAECNLRALETFRRKWKGDLSLDLISGLPGEDEQSLIKTLETVCQKKPDHISLYSLTIEDNTPFGKALKTGGLNYDFENADKLWIMGRDFLISKGYNWYEVSNFSRPEKECRHNLCYWSHESYLGCGAAACGSFYYDDGRALRWINSENIEEYISFWTSPDLQTFTKTPEKIPQEREAVDLETSEFEFFMMGLRKLKGVSENEFYRSFHKALPEKFIKLFEKWQKKNLCVKSEAGRYSMTSQGMLFLNRFLEELEID